MNTGQQLVLNLLSVQAAELARAGRYEAAESLLSPMSNAIQDSALCLDLLARIRAQQGAFSEAEALWMKAAQLSPADSKYDHALHRIAKARRSPRYYAYGRVIALSGFAFLFFAVAVIGVWKLGHRPASQAADPALKAVLPQNPLSRMPAPIEPKASSLESYLRLDGVSTKKFGNEYVLTFTSGLFSRGVRLRPRARNILTTLAIRLESHPDDISIQIVGFTDDLVPPSDKSYENATLALRRALVVAEYMRRNSRLPARAITIGYGDTSQSPFPNDSSEHRLMNRSVIVRVASAQ